MTGATVPQGGRSATGEGAMEELRERARWEHLIAVQNLRAGWFLPGVAEDARYGAAAAREYAKCAQFGCVDHLLPFDTAA